MPDLDASAKRRVIRNAVVLAVVVFVWIAIDYATKRYFDSGEFTLGQNIAGPFLGLFRFTLVHNTGAAWGIFAGNTVLLGVFSVVMCVVLLVLLVALKERANLGVVLGIALVVGGGIGNAIDRLAGNYVVDFIDFTFMQFPVFNVADIGVTCGIVLFFLAYLVGMRKVQDSDAGDEGDQGAASSQDAAPGEAACGQGEAKAEVDE